MKITITIPDVDVEGGLDSIEHNSDPETPPMSVRDVIAQEIMTEINTNYYLSSRGVWITHVGDIDFEPDEPHDVDMFFKLNSKIRYCLQHMGLDHTLRAVGAIATEMHQRRLDHARSD